MVYNIELIQVLDGKRYEVDVLLSDLGFFVTFKGAGR